MTGVTLERESPGRRLLQQLTERVRAWRKGAVGKIHLDLAITHLHFVLTGGAGGWELKEEREELVPWSLWL